MKDLPARQTESARSVIVNDKERKETLRFSVLGARNRVGGHQEE